MMRRFVNDGWAKISDVDMKCFHSLVRYTFFSSKHDSRLLVMGAKPEPICKAKVFRFIHSDHSFIHGISLALGDLAAAHSSHRN